MGQTRTENFIFSLICCLMMVVGMTIYNVTLATGELWTGVLAIGSSEFVMMFLIALMIDWFVVAPIVKGAVARWTNEQTSLLKKVLLISCFMVLLMCTAMSLVATLVHGYGLTLWQAYLAMFSKNIIFALPLQLLLVGPIARKIFLTLCPPKPAAVAY